MGNRVASCVHQHNPNDKMLRYKKAKRRDVQSEDVSAWLKESKSKTHSPKPSEQAAKRLSVVTPSPVESPAIRRIKVDLTESEIQNSNIENPWEKKLDEEMYPRNRPFSEYKMTELSPSVMETLALPRISCHEVGIPEQGHLSPKIISDFDSQMDHPLSSPGLISENSFLYPPSSDMMSDAPTCVSMIRKSNQCNANCALMYPLQDVECSLRRILQEFLTEVYPLTSDILQQLEQYGLLEYLKWNVPLDNVEPSSTERAIQFFDMLIYSPSNLLTLADVLSPSIHSEKDQIEQFQSYLARVIRCCVDLIDWVGNVQFTMIKRKVPLNLVFDGKSDPIRDIDDFESQENGYMRANSFGVDIVFYSTTNHSVTSLNEMKDSIQEASHVQPNQMIRLFERKEKISGQMCALSLDLSGFHLRVEDWFKLATISATYENICVLSLAESNLTEECLTEILQSFNAGKHLHHLNLKFINLSQFEQLHFFSRASNCLVNIVHLNLSCCDMQSSTFYHFLKSHLTYLINLNILDVSYNNFSTLRVKAMKMMLSLRLKELNLRSTQLSLECSAVLFDWLKRNGRLKILDISGNNLMQHESAVIQMAAGIAYNTMLKELFCENIGLKHNNRSIHIFSKAALMNRSLEVIDISDNRLGDEGATALVDLLKWKSSLHVLHLNQCNLTGRGIHTLLSACLSSELRDLSVRGNITYLEPIQKKRIAELHQQILANRTFQLLI